MNQNKGKLIGWARWSWNPLYGCLHNCPACYARQYSEARIGRPFTPTVFPERFNDPIRQKIPAKLKDVPGGDFVFVGSMTDLFGNWWSAEQIEQVLSICRDPRAVHWVFCFLTQNPYRLREFSFPERCLVGTTIYSQDRVDAALSALLAVDRPRFISVEPMTEPLEFPSLQGVSWVLIGGRTPANGIPGAQPRKNWVESVIRQARDAGAAVFLKDNLKVPGLEPCREWPKLPKDDLSVAS